MKINMFYLNSLAEANVTCMDSMFEGSTIQPDISKWDVSKVENMAGMFSFSKFNQPIGNWVVSQVTNINCMFFYSDFNQDISSWDISKAGAMSSMFARSKFNQNLGAWNLSNKYTQNIFEQSCYSMEKYQEDRNDYLEAVIVQKNLSENNSIEFEF